jgi:ATP-dependent RNA helicase DDX23/PRP28
MLICARAAQNLKQKHWSEKPREAMNARDWRIFREDHRMSFKNAGPNAPLPFRSWDEMPLPPPLRAAISDLGYEKPSPIQMASMPFGLRQRDVIGLAETGSGKTAAFVLPMLVYIMGQPEMTEAVAAEGPYALVLAPTRELTQQISEETTKLSKHTRARLFLLLCLCSSHRACNALPVCVVCITLFPAQCARPVGHLCTFDKQTLSCAVLRP